MLIIRRLLQKMVRMHTMPLVVSTVFLIIFSSYFIHLIEPETFPSPFDGLWWVMTTVTTVGYGDLYPKSIEGRLYAFFLFLTGIGLISISIGKIIDAFTLYHKRMEEGKMDYHGKGHIILIGWSKKVELAIQEIRSTYAKVDIVVIAKLDKSPTLEKNVHFVSGSPLDTSVLEQANLKEARSAIIFADEDIPDHELADNKSSAIAIKIEAFAPHVRTIVEVLSKSHVDIFKYSKVDDFIFPHETISHLAVRSAFAEGISKLFSQLVSNQLGPDLFEVKPRPEWKTYRDAFQALLKQGATLIADGDDLTINTRLDDSLSSDSRLFVICTKNAYEQVIATKR